jgi:hypothetical protein
MFALLFRFHSYADHSFIGVWIRDHTFALAIIEAIHLIGITLMLGTICTVNFRLFGFALKSRPVHEVVEGFGRWTTVGYIWVFSTGILLFIAEALKLHDNAAWPAKIVFLFLAILVQSTMYRSVIKPGKAEASPWMAKLTAALSMLFWFGTGFAGRAIGFF